MATDVKELLRKHRLKDAIHVMRQYAADYPEVRAAERLQKIEEDYQLMLDFMYRGFKDDKREQMYQSLIHKLYILEMDTIQAEDFRKNAFYSEAYAMISRKHWEHDLIRYSLENYVTEEAMLSLNDDNDRLGKERDLNKRHSEFMSVLFRKLWLSYQWNEVEAGFYEELFLSPTIESRDVQLMVSALTLATMKQFDVLKFRTLVHVYQQTSDVYVRERSLVAIAFSMNADADFFGEEKSLLSSLLEDDRVCRELLELQMQVVYCLNADEDNRTIQKDIMPTLLRNNSFEITRFGIIEKEDDPMEDILNPGAADQAMEEMENTVERMMDMQKAGSDIYFGGFSMMKTFPFFRDIANWLTPFYKENPALNIITDKLKETGLMDTIVANGPFCDSDKYSFALAISTVIDRLPANIKEMLGTADALGPVMPKEDMLTPAYIRRMYLQDLYRFFRLFPRRSEMANPFERTGNYHQGRRCVFFAEPLLHDSPLCKYVVELGNFLLKHQRMEELDAVISNFEMDSVHSTPEGLDMDLQFLLLKAVRNEYLSKEEVACLNYELVLALDKDNLLALKNLARLRFLLGDYDRAAQCYSHLVELQPGKKNYELNYSAALLKLGVIDEAMRIIYKLDYDAPDDVIVKRVKAWGLMAQAKLDQARELYAQLRNNVQAQPADSLNAGYCEWLSGDIMKAAELFKDYLKLLNNDGYNISTDFEHDADFLIQNGIRKIDMDLMNDLLTP